MARHQYFLGIHFRVEIPGVEEFIEVVGLLHACEQGADKGLRKSVLEATMALQVHFYEG